MKKHCPESINSSWINFIEDKNLGITCIKSSIHKDGDEYRIIDEKKWLLAKIKYGF